MSSNFSPYSTITRRISGITKLAFINRVNYSFYGFSFLEKDAEGISTMTIPVFKWKKTKAQVAAERIAGTLDKKSMDERHKAGDIRTLTQLEVLEYIVEAMPSTAESYDAIYAEYEDAKVEMESKKDSKSWASPTEESTQQIQSSDTTDG